MRSATTYRNSNAMSRYEQGENEELPQFYTDVERHERAEKVRPGKLQCFPERKRESEAMNQAEAERNHPPAFYILCDDVLDRHVDDRHRDQRFYKRRKP